MKIPDWALKVGHYLIRRLNEPSTYRGLLLFIGAGSWAKLDGGNKGEIIMAACLMLAGAVQAAVPQNVLYKTKDAPADG